MDKIQNNNKIYDLEERIAVFGENVIDLAKELPKNSLNNPFISYSFKL